MKAFKISGLAALTCLSLAVGQSAQAEMLNLGTASGGQSIKLDTNSIQRNGRGMSWGAAFTYYLGGEQIKTGAHCGLGTWAVDGQTYKPQSQATRNMISVVCSARHIDENKEDTGYMLVFAPPSNVRSSPGGSIKCTLKNMQVVPVYVEPRGDWYSTSACGDGWIHKSQVRAFR
ncbi:MULTISPECIES: hypothetical protein [Trichocoleus]|uniref:Uncharacterized protein n=1 Tax=Trichocoleus desertorum GB2-A4 TaxID=2933944 RepID=A0ABV0JEP4_9CYAN|nr:hypothetical protein [Trichocoleus sp. FACHB-46]MBD1864206.1 hypothetical protein [Trichocoleus sp. FACHB-46]